MDGPVINDHKKDNLGVVAGRLGSLQKKLEDLQIKLSRTVLGLESLLYDEDPGTGNENDYEIKTTSSSKLSENVHHRRSVGMQKATEDRGRMVNKENGTNDFDKPEVKTSDMNDPLKTCDYWSLPQWCRDNNYILKDYRPPCPSFMACFTSIFRLHTETLNIWTHLLGCLLFIALFLHTTLGSLNFKDKLVLFPFFVGAIFCLSFSTAFHILHCHSQKVCSFFSRLDFCGITLLIVGSFVPWLYYAFYCNKRLQLLYLAGVLTLGISSTSLTFSETFRQPTYKPLRATVFVVFGLSGVIPGIHFIVIEGWEVFVTFGTPLLLTAFLYIFGAVIYACRIPERIFPGKCDIMFQSHQIFHVLVVVATLIDYVGLLRIAAFAGFTIDKPDFCLRRQFYFRQF